MQKGSEKGVRSGEWGMGMGKQIPIPHSLFPIHHFLFALLALLAFLASPSTFARKPGFKIAASQDQVSIRWASDPANPYKVAVEVHGLSVAAIKRLRRTKPT